VQIRQPPAIQRRDEVNNTIKIYQQLHLRRSTIPHHRPISTLTTKIRAMNQIPRRLRTKPLQRNSINLAQRESAIIHLRVIAQRDPQHNRTPIHTAIRRRRNTKTLYRSLAIAAKAAALQLHVEARACTRRDVENEVLGSGDVGAVLQRVPV